MRVKTLPVLYYAVPALAGEERPQLRLPGPQHRLLRAARRRARPRLLPDARPQLRHDVPPGYLHHGFSRPRQRVPLRPDGRHQGQSHRLLHLRSRVPGVALEARAQPHHQRPAARDARRRLSTRTIRTSTGSRTSSATSTATPSGSSRAAPSSPATGGRTSSTCCSTAARPWATS